MKMCQPHWEKLKQAIISKGLNDLISADGKEVVKRMVGEIAGEKQTRRNFDPLMAAHNMILNNAMDTASRVGGNPLAIIAGDPEHPEWECPICYLNWLSEEHDRNCTEPNCPKERGLKFDDWIDQAANGAAEFVKTLPES